MVFKTCGNDKNPAVLFFHAMGVTGESSERVAEFMKDRYFCIMPTSSVYTDEGYESKREEVRELEEFLVSREIKKLSLVVASSIGTDLAMDFLSKTSSAVGYVFFDGGQFAQIGRLSRYLMVPFLYLAIKSIYWTHGRSLKRIMWCSDDEIKPYFIAAGKSLSYKSLCRQLSDSLENKPFWQFQPHVQRRMFFGFGSVEEHIKYRDAVMKAYPEGHFPVFRGYRHMEYQIKDPKGFADMLCFIIEHGRMPDLEFLEK